MSATTCPPWCTVHEHDEDERWHCSGGPGGFWNEDRARNGAIRRADQGSWNLDLVSPVDTQVPSRPTIWLQLSNATGSYVGELLGAEARELAAALIFMADRELFR
jgi:hypothetical protein